MTNFQGRSLTLLAAFAALTFSLTLVAWSGSANQSVNPQEADKQLATPENDLPVLDLKHTEKTGSEQLKGRKRGHSLRQHRRIEELPAGAEPIASSAHGRHWLPALPVEESNAFVGSAK